ncbi:MAG: hypothetical protein KatS3mg115_1823 [Candidatus Poribacteria bacterium]|nr:MAG: hypothetical protein KatS3mg115_1823 [Candidatus Poribacteria bacterium]
MSLSGSRGAARRPVGRRPDPRRPGLYRYRDPSRIPGDHPSFTEALEWYTDEGRFFEEEEMVDWDKVAVIGYSVAVELFGEDADPIGQQITVNGQRYTIVGIMEPRGTSIQYGWNLDQTVIIPLTTAQKRFQGSDEIPMIQVQAVSTEKILDAMAEVERVLLKRHRNEQFYQIWAPGTQNLEFVTKLSKMLRVVLGGIAGFSLLVGGIGIMNIMLVSVTERTREIGLRKALGAKRRDILVQFLIEATVLCLVGGFIGLSLGLGFGYGSAKIMSNPSIGGFIGGLLGFRGDWVAWPFEVPIPWTIISIGVSVAIGVFFGLYPAWKASRLTPIEALRHT